MATNRRLVVRAIVTIAFALFTFLVTSTPASAQIAGGSILAPDGSDWRDLALYRAGGRLFILDYTSARVLAYDATALAYIGEISFSAYAPDKPQGIDVYESTGTLYVTLSAGLATSETRALAINASTLAIGPTINNLGWDAGLTMDEAHSRIYAISVSQKILRSIDPATNTVTGTLDLDDLMPNGLMTYGRESLNPSTGELLFSNIHYDTFLVVNGPALTGQLFSVANSRGRGGAWNPTENKLYITTVTWGGYFIYDRDTQASMVTICSNDGTSLFYSAPTNRVYSGAEVNGDTTVIEGATDSCQNVDVGGGQPEVAFLPSKGLVFFAGAGSVTALSEATLQQTASITPCGGGFGGAGASILANDATGRVYVLGTWSSPSQDSCLLLVVTPSLSIGDASVSEGNAGTKTLSFPVTLSTAAASTITVHYTTSNGSGTGTVTFLAGETAKSIDISVNGDAICEGDQTFTVTLDTPTAGVTLADAQATGTILDDDGSIAPAAVVATASSATSVGVGWNIVGDAASYDVFRDGVKIGSTAATVYTDNTAASGTSYLYAVRSVNSANCPSPLSTADLATTVMFTDAVLPSATVKAGHVTQLRTATAAVRTRAGLGAFSFTDSPLSAGMLVKALHVAELRTALNAARAALGLPAIAYGDPSITAGMVVEGGHVEELRGGVR